MRKNVASQVIAGQMNDRTTGAPLTTGVSVLITGDGGTQTASGGTLTHKGNGHWSYAPTQAETNFNHIAFTFTHSTGVHQTVNVFTVSFNPHDTVRLGLTALPNAAAEAAGGLYTRGTGAGQINQQTNGQVDANAERVRNGVVNVLIAGRVDANAQVVGDKTGYSLTQAFPTNFASMSITVGGLVDITQAAADKVWGSTTRTLSAFSTALAVSVWDVLETAILTASSIGLKVKNNLDAAISSRLATAGYTAPDNAGITNIQSRLPAALVAGRMDSDMTAISGDAPAADNLEATYDGSGYSNNFAPSTQQQVAALSAGVAAINIGATAFVRTRGVETGTFSNTLGDDGVYHQIDGEVVPPETIDVYYEFDVGPTGVPTNLLFNGRLFNANDLVTVFGFNWGTSLWEQIGIISGKNQTTDDTFNFTLFQRFKGTGANIGKVRIRFFDNTVLTSASLFVDQLVLSYITFDEIIIRAGQVVAGGTNTVDIDAGASAINDFYKPSLIIVRSVTGEKQARRVEAYDGGVNKRITVATNWSTIPDSTYTFEIRPWASVRVSDIDAGVQVEADIRRVNNIQVKGVGTDVDPWNPV